MEDGKLDELREQRKRLWKNVKASHILLVRAHSLCESLELRYNNDKLAYEKCDHELALLDGRTKVCEPVTTPTSSHKRKPKQVVELTAQDIIRIAKELGIKLEEPDELSTSGT